jgi:hypothetical protein
MSITINGKQYDEQSLSPDLKNTIIARQEILNSKARHQVELEKIDVLTDFYNKKIEKLVKEQEPKEIVEEKEE